MEGRSQDRGRDHDSRFASALGRTIKVVRTDREMGRKDLAERVGISYSYLTEIENGNKPPSNSVLTVIADVLGLTLGELIATAEDRMASQAQGTTFEPPSSDVWWEEGRGESVAPPSSRRRRALQNWPPRHEGSPEETRRAGAAGPGARQTPGDLAPPSSFPMESVVSELWELMAHLSPEDQYRVLDLARRLAR
jgi:transcriptional regulator with XRE-family HTH domain